MGLYIIVSVVTGAFSFYDAWRQFRRDWRNGWKAKVLWLGIHGVGVISLYGGFVVFLVYQLYIRKAVFGASGFNLIPRKGNARRNRVGVNMGLLEFLERKGSLPTSARELQIEGRFGPDEISAADYWGYLWKTSQGITLSPGGRDALNVYRSQQG